MTTLQLDTAPEPPATGPQDFSTDSTITGTPIITDRPRKGRYANLAPDRHPLISMGLLLMRPAHRAGRIFQRKKSDSQADVSCGDQIVFKEKGTTRFMFQNVKGLTNTTGSEDYNYYLSWMSSFSVDVFRNV